MLKYNSVVHCIMYYRDQCRCFLIGNQWKKDLSQQRCNLTWPAFNLNNNSNNNRHRKLIYLQLPCLLFPLFYYPCVLMHFEVWYNKLKTLSAYEEIMMVFTSLYSSNINGSWILGLTVHYHPKSFFGHGLIFMTYKF